MKTHVLMFQDRFADKVELGTKPHTIRKARKRPIKRGDFLSLRKWLGKPYRSKQKILREGKCQAVSPITINEDSVWLERWAGICFQLSPRRLEEFAIRDGFANAGEMIKWFEDTHGLPFEGVLIEWPISTTPQ